MSSFTTPRYATVPFGNTKPSGATVESTWPASRGQDTDENLVTATQGGDREALALLFRRHAQRVRHIGQRILRANSEADDLVQEVFLYLHRKSALFDATKGSARSWIIQVAYTQALLRRRELKSHGFYLSG